MSSIVKKLNKHKLINPEQAFVTDTVYEVIMGSVAYGLSNKTSDMDVYGVCVPSKTIIFPHLNGYIKGFGPKPESFEVYQKHHIDFDEKEYDINIYSIINYFQLCSENNPNMIDSLFVPDRCIIHMDDVGHHMRSHRKLFLSKRIFDKLRGYAFSELKKLEKYDPEKNSKREKLVEKYGYNTKSAYHVVRLMLEAEMVLHEGDLDLEHHREQLKFVREGGYTLEELKQWFKHKEQELTTVHTNSELQPRVNYKRLNELLFECLEMHFGTLNMAKIVDSEAVNKLEKIKEILNN